jgi:YD repeat-containing protein
MHVDPAYGNFVYTVEDFSIPCRGGMLLQVVRYYDSQSEHKSNATAGYLEGWCFNFDERLRFEFVGPFTELEPLPGMDYMMYPPDDPASSEITLRAISLVLPDRRILRYKNVDGTFVPMESWYTCTLEANDDGTYTVDRPGVGSHRFRPDGRLKAIVDTHGNAITYDWTTPEGSDQLYMYKITDPSGRVIRASGERADEETAAYTLTDWTGRSWTYVFKSYKEDRPTHLASVTDAEGQVTRYTYGPLDTVPPPSREVLRKLPEGFLDGVSLLNGMGRIDFPNGTFVTNYAGGPRPIWKRVGLQVFGDRLPIVNTYNTADGVNTRYVGSSSVATVFNLDPFTMLNTSSVDPLGNTYEHTYDSDGRPVKTIDPRLGVWAAEYDDAWNVVSQTSALGNTRTIEYHPTFNFPTRVTSPGAGGDQTVTHAYDPETGRLVSTTDPLGATVLYEYDEYGHVTAITGKLGERYTYTWDEVTGNCISATDAMGGVYTYGYDELGRLISKSSPEGRTYRYGYSPCGMLTSVTDPGGSVRTMAYDGNRNLIEEVDALGYVTRYQYNVLNELVQTTDKMGSVTTYTYTPEGQLATMTDALGRTTRYDYDALMRPVAVTDAQGNVTTTTYDSSCGEATSTDSLGRTQTTFKDLACRVTETTLADGSVVTTTYNDDDTVQSTTDAMGNVTRYLTDALGRVVQATDALGRVTKTTYDGVGNVLTTTDASGNVTRTSYDLNYRPVATTRPDGVTLTYTYDRDGLQTSWTDGRGKVWQTRYDANGRAVGAIDPVGNIVQSFYDEAGRPVRTVTPLGRTTALEHDAFGRVIATTDPEGGVSQRVYDVNGRLVTTIDPLGRATHLVYDELGRMVKTVDPAGSITSRTYDAGGRLTAVTDANGNPTRYEYDERDRVIAEIYADGSRLTYTWDANGNMLSKTDPRGFRTTYEYNAGNQLVRVMYPDNAEVTMTYDLNGNITQRVDGTGVYGFVYDSLNRPVQIIQDGAVYKLEYDPDGRRVAVTFPDTRRTTTSYDDIGRSVGVTTPDGETTTMEYDADGRRTGIQYSNQTASIAAYDLNARLVRLVHFDSAGSNITPDLRMTYDATGNILTVHDGATPMWSYAYDVLDRLTSATNEQAASTASWMYDAVGNRLSETVDGVRTDSTYNSLNQLIRQGTTRFFWDANGNLAQKVATDGVTTYRFDSRDRLVEVQLPDTRSIFYSYDQLSRMVRRTDDAGSTTFEWSGWDIQRETNASGQVTRYLYNGSEMVGFAKDDQQYRVHSDWLGSARAVTDHTGTTVATFDYGPWGGQTGVSDGVPGGFACGFVGAYGVRWDETADLYYMRQRW